MVQPSELVFFSLTWQRSDPDGGFVEDGATQLWETLWPDFYGELRVPWVFDVLRRLNERSPNTTQTKKKKSWDYEQLYEVVNHFADFFIIWTPENEQKGQVCIKYKGCPAVLAPGAMWRALGFDVAFAMFTEYLREAEERCVWRGRATRELEFAELLRERFQLLTSTFAELSKLRLGELQELVKEARRRQLIGWKSPEKVEGQTEQGPRTDEDGKDKDVLVPYEESDDRVNEPWRKLRGSIQYWLMENQGVLKYSALVRLAYPITPSDLGTPTLLEALQDPRMSSVCRVVEVQGTETRPPLHDYLIVPPGKTSATQMPTNRSARRGRVGRSGAASSSR